MDKVLTTALLTIAAVVAAVMVVNAILPAVSTGGTSLISSSRNEADRIGTSISIIRTTHINNLVRFWVKNVGTTEIHDIENADVFVEGSTEYRMNHGGEGETCPADADDKWFHQYEDDEGSWTPSVTLKITVCVGGGTSTKVYFTTDNGITGEAFVDG